MRILWLTVDRTSRVASHIFTSLQDEVSKISDVTLFTRQINMVMGQYCNKAVNGDIIVKQTPYSTNYINNNFDVVFTDAIFGFLTEDWNDIKIQKAVLIEDQHGSIVEKYVKRTYYDFKFDLFFVRYRDATKRFYPYLYNKTVIWLPHSIPNKIFKDYKQEKIHGVLQTGAVTQSYPIRQHLNRILKTETYYRRILRPTENLNMKQWPCGKDYARLINQSYMAISCTSKYQYPVLKTFEIPACNTALVSDCITEMYDLGFVPNKNFIEVNNKTNVDSFRKHMLDKDKIKKISNRGFKLIHENHRAKHRAKEFIEALEKL